MAASVWRTSITALLLSGLVVAACTPSSPARRSEAGADETVHVGYGAEEKETTTSATSSVTPTETDQEQTATFRDLLQGQTAGVHVQQTSAGIRVTIRGITSVNADTTPLYVLDGTPTEPSANGTIPVRPQEVTSITVLKDAGATSVYGTRGANGVIVIETTDQ